MRARLAAAVAAGLCLSALPAVERASAGEPAGCFDSALPLTAEEQRLARGADPVGPRLVRAGGFAELVAEFRATLCATESMPAAGTAVTRAGQRLWQAAVDRAQGRAPGTGTLDELDDRPLYWARLQLSSAVRQWDPGFGVNRPQLLTALQHASRGVGATGPAPAGVPRALISGFDPFGFDGDLRLSNPSGAAALRLDGQIVDTADGPVAVEAVVFPVTWAGFDDGIVEAAFGPALSAPDRRPDVLMTISQGAGFTIERWAAGWRGGQPDNNGAGAEGPVPAAAGWPASTATLIETTLPVSRMLAAGTGPREVYYSRFYCYWPAGTAPGSGPTDCRDDGAPPLPGETGEMGSGGNFLSNESMFRANRLRIGLGATGVLGGHLHIPPGSGPADPDALSDPASDADRRAIVAQTTALLAAAATSR
ncbi:hypothetical protein [Catenuloplanes atrovinosus]|uniref:Pyrrolidone-carboxylate peptidase n=1 Tax=Catenuloplanes atrovinosus TaxID=137266 RepID=A0AAE4C951_9ACTN|nr:hypothetical protein [Catenuloplanes atrovinosus]MDR7275683.1 hypothetical protein [Catenuloplanes atrovinosus]